MTENCDPTEEGLKVTANCYNGHYYPIQGDVPMKKNANGSNVYYFKVKVIKYTNAIFIGIGSKATNYEKEIDDTTGNAILS